MPQAEPAIDGRPVYWFALDSFSAAPYDASEDCDPATPRVGCPCTGVQHLCPRGLECGNPMSPNVWVTYPDICGIG
jgi:hypothetical protein